MALIGKIQTLFSDREKTTPVFPRTVTSAIIHNNEQELDNILDRVTNELDTNVIVKYTHSSSGLVSENQKAAENGKFKAYDTMEIESININNTIYIVNTGSIKITKDSWYMFFLDKSNNTIHFLSSSGASTGGLSDYVITYNVNGGTLPLDSIVIFGQTTPSFALPEPTRDGYTFKGWYDNAEFTGNIITQVMQGTKKDLEFYAKWEANSYTYNIVYKSSSGAQLGTEAVAYQPLNV